MPLRGKLFLPETKAGTLVPPSHRVFLLPLRGKLLPPLSVWPPLSLVNTASTRKINMIKNNNVQ